MAVLAEPIRQISHPPFRHVFTPTVQRNHGFLQPPQRLLALLALLAWEIWNVIFARQEKPTAVAFCLSCMILFVIEDDLLQARAFLRRPPRGRIPKDAGADFSVIANNNPRPCIGIIHLRVCCRQTADLLACLGIARLQATHAIRNGAAGSIQPEKIDCVYRVISHARQRIESTLGS